MTTGGNFIRAVGSRWIIFFNDDNSRNTPGDNFARKIQVADNISGGITSVNQGTVPLTMRSIHLKKKNMSYTVISHATFSHETS